MSGLSKKIFKKHFLALLIFFGFCFLYWWTYGHELGKPLSKEAMGFMGGYDRSRYLMMAQVFPKLTKREFAFGIGYPILGVPFRKIHPLNSPDRSRENPW